MATDKGAKRQKRTESMELIGMLDLDGSLELEKDLGEATFDMVKDVQLPSMNDQSATPQRQLSFDTYERQGNMNLDDCFLERDPAQRGSSLFFGLALVCGAVGTFSSFTQHQVDPFLGGAV